MPLRIKVKRPPPQPKQVHTKQMQDFRRAVSAGLQDAAKEIETDGRDIIAMGGNFSSARWQEGWHADASKFGIKAYHDVPYATVFEFGAEIHGQPLLWIPMAYTGIKVSASEYPDQLFRVDRKWDGLPLLLSAEDKQVKYFGKEKVRIPQKWHLRKMIRQVVKEDLPRFIRNQMAKSRG